MYISYTKPRTPHFDISHKSIFVLQVGRMRYLKQCLQTLACVAGSFCLFAQVGNGSEAAELSGEAVTTST